MSERANRRASQRGDERSAAVAPAEGGAAPSFVTAFVAMFAAVLKTLAKTVFVVDLDSAEATSRAGIFLLAFTVAHALGNLSFFAGADAFNKYGHKLTSMPGFAFVEYYLLVGGAVHVLASTYRTMKFKVPALQRSKKPDFWGALRLAVSGTILAVFVVTHLLDFRFAKSDSDIVSVDGVEVHNIYALQRKVFGESKHVVWYVFAVAMLGVHLWYGWPKAVAKFDPKSMDRPTKRAVTSMGRAAIFPVVGIFSAVVLYTAYTNPKY